MVTEIVHSRTVSLPSIGVRRHRRTLTSRPSMRRLEKPCRKPVVAPRAPRPIVDDYRDARPYRGTGRGSLGSGLAWLSVVLAALMILCCR